MRASIGLCAVLAIAGCQRTNNSDASDAGIDGAAQDAASSEDVTASDQAMDSGRNYEPEAFVPTEQTRAYCAGRDAASSDAIEARITELLRSLTRNEKRALMSGAGLGRIEGVWQVRGVSRLNIPGFRMIDGPRGVAVTGANRATAFATASLRGASWDPSLEERVGQAMADEARSVGANVLLAPTMNILRHPRWGRAQETYGEDSWHMGSMAGAFVRGVQSRGVLASLKHYAANSIEDTRHTVDVQMSERTLREVYLPHFRRAIHEGNAASVMAGYNQLLGRYCDQNSLILTDILRTEWGFSGFVMSDWVLGTHGAVDSVRAGLDLEMPSQLEFAALGSALSSGSIAEHEIDRSLRRMLRAQLCYALGERSYSNDPTARETAAHLALARESARRGIVLLANRPVMGAPVLPLSASALRSVVVMGRAANVANIGDRGSSAVIPSAVVTALDAMRARAGAQFTVTHVMGSALDDGTRAIVRDASAVLFVTGNIEADEGEADIAAGDRASMSLPPGEESLLREVLATNARTIVLLEGGSAILTAPWDSAANAMLWAGYPGAQGGLAITDVLFGDVEPAGRLPFSMPVREEDLVPFDNTSTRVTYEYLHGYRHLQAQRRSPRFAFGFGLSYSTVAYESLSLASNRVSATDTIEATVTVRNTGARAARETAQLYVSAQGSMIERAPMDLRAFAQQEIAPGAVATMVLRIPARELAIWDETTRVMRVEPGSYELRVGSSSEDTPLRATVEVR